MHPSVESAVLNHLMEIVFWATVASNVLPPIEFFDKLPRFQAAYRAVINVIQYYAALNLRGKIAQAYITRRAENENTQGGGVTIKQSDGE